MKKLLLILLCMPLLFSCGENKNDLTSRNIKGNVKEIIETTFDAKEVFGEPQKGDLRYNYRDKYNEYGNVTENTSYNADGELISEWKYQFDEDGNRTVGMIFGEDGELDGRYNYQYDEDGNWQGLLGIMQMEN